MFSLHVLKSVEVRLDPAARLSADRHIEAVCEAVMDQVRYTVLICKTTTKATLSLSQLEGRFEPSLDGYIVCAGEVKVLENSKHIVVPVASDEVAAFARVDVEVLVFSASPDSVVDGCISRILPEPVPRYALDDEDEPWTSQHDDALVK